MPCECQKSSLDTLEMLVNKTEMLVTKKKKTKQNSACVELQFQWRRQVNA